MGHTDDNLIACVLCQLSGLLNLTIYVVMVMVKSKFIHQVVFLLVLSQCVKYIGILVHLVVNNLVDVCYFYNEVSKK